MSPGRLLPTLLRVSWAALPIVAGPAFAGAFDERSRPVQLAGSIGLWAVWAGVLSAALVSHPLTLTIVRAAAPGAVAAGVATTLAGASSIAAATAAAAGLVVTFLAMLPEVGIAFVNGPAYPNERRYPLRAPGPLLAGPLELAWVACVALPASGVLLLASRQWLPGSLVALGGTAAIAVLGRSMYTLARRWVVFVPAGVVLHDPMTLADPMLFRRKDIASFDLAPAGTDATDLTAKALGMAIELSTSEPVKLAVVQPRSRVPTMENVSKLLFAPTRPGAVLAEARARRIG